MARIARRAGPLDRARGLTAGGGTALPGLGKLERGRVHHARVLGEVVAQLRPLRGVAAALEHHRARGGRDLVGGRVLHAIGADGRAALAQGHVAGGDDVLVGLPLDAIGLEEITVATGGAARFDELQNLLERHRRLLVFEAAQ